MMKNIVGNWTFAPIYTVEAGESMTVQSGVDANLNGDAAADRSVINPKGQDGVGSNVTALMHGANDWYTLCSGTGSAGCRGAFAHV